MIPGKPNVLFYTPEFQGSKDYKKDVNLENVKILLQEYTIKPTLYNPSIEDLVELLKPETSPPTSVEEALYLFSTLLNEIEKLEVRNRTNLLLRARSR